MELEPGPIVREPMPLGPRVFTPGLFASRAALLLGALRDSDAGFAAVELEIAGNAGDGLAASFAGSIDAAADAAANQANWRDDRTADTLVDAGGGADAYRQSVLRYLPQPDAPITTSFDDPPQPPSPGADVPGVQVDQPQV
jgi:hypothetical protein